MSVEKAEGVMKAFSPFVGSVLTLAESTAMEGERLHKFKKVLQRRIYEARNYCMEMSGNDFSLVLNAMADDLVILCSASFGSLEQAQYFCAGIAIHQEELRINLEDVSKRIEIEE